MLLSELLLDDSDETSVSAVAVLNPLTASTYMRSVGYIPVKFPSAPDLTFWALLDTGAMVSVVSAGLANFLGLV